MARRHPLARWFQEHTPEQGAQLCKLAKTSRPYLRHVIAGRRSLSLEMKLELEIAASTIDKSFESLNVGGMDTMDRYEARYSKVVLSD